MDLRLFSRVLWRFRFLVAGGLVLACVLSFLSFASISFAGGSPKLTYRQTERWKATAVLFVTQKGFPYGYTVLPTSPTQATPSGAGASRPGPERRRVFRHSALRLAGDHAARRSLRAVR